MNDFHKYHGLGNDFVLVESEGAEVDPGWVEAVCDRHRGVGADGVLVVTPPVETESVGRMVLYNRDGTRPEMCGNGIRCVARHLVEQTGREGDVLPIDTDAGRRACRIVERGDGAWSVSVEMGRAQVEQEAADVTAAGVSRTFWAVDVGNPHAVTFGGATEGVVDAFGEKMNSEAVERFPNGVNVEFVDIVGEAQLRSIVFERGVGRTRACGTGACASAVAAWRSGRISADGPATVELPGGELEIAEADDEMIWMTGPVQAVFAGEFSPRWR